MQDQKINKKTKVLLNSISNQFPCRMLHQESIRNLNNQNKLGRRNLLNGPSSHICKDDELHLPRLSLPIVRKDSNSSRKTNLPKLPSLKLGDNNGYYLSRKEKNAKKSSLFTLAPPPSIQGT